MKPHVLNIDQKGPDSFTARQDTVTSINNRWHQHPQAELICFHKGTGTQFIGDSIKRFGAGDVLLLGKNLPHYWKFDEEPAKPADRAVPYTTVIHFREDFWGDQFLDLPENYILKKLLENAGRGIQISGSAKDVVSGHMQRLLSATGARRLLYLMEALVAIAGCRETGLLSSVGFRFERKDAEERMNRIYDYSVRNYREQISLQEIAGAAHISPSSFCRYFKSCTNKTYRQFLHELRIGMACKLLLETGLSVKDICYESGFNNFASFHRHFKHMNGMTPLLFRQQFRNP